MQETLERSGIVSVETAVAALAAVGIIAHLALRGLEAAPRLQAAPLDCVLLFGATPLIVQIFKKLLAREFGSDFLAGISLLVSILMGQRLVGAILVLMLSGGWTLERLASRRASSVLEALAKRVPRTAHLNREGRVDDVDIGRVGIGDVLIVYPHEICPVDGTVVEGSGSMDESYLTGEPFGISKTVGSPVLSGAINGSSALTISARKLAVDSRYANIMRVMEDTEKNRPPMRRLADQLAAWYTPLVLAAAGSTRLLSGDSSRVLAVLVTATPCPLLIAIPVAVIGAISLAAGRGIVVKNPAVLERITHCKTVILDKTGTLTLGKPALTEILPSPGFDAQEALALAASLEQYSRHPLAGAILAAAEDAGVALRPVQEAGEFPGEGLRGIVGRRKVLVTGRKTAAQRFSALPPPAAAGLECLVFVDEAVAAVLRFRDAPRPESRPFLSHLPRAHEISKIMVLSGDREAEVRYLADLLDVTDIAAEKSPEEKVAIVRQETERAETLFIGDGINDAPALAAATVGVAMGPNSDIASEAAGAVILTASIAKLDELIHIGRRMRAIALQSAAGGMAASLAAMALASTGRLSSVQGAVVQEIIDLAAVLNAVRAARPPKKITDF